MEIKTSFGGPYIYKQGIMPDGTKTGKIRWSGESPEQVRKALIDAIKTGRDDVSSFVDSVIARGEQ